MADSTATDRTLLTYEDFKNLPDDGMRHEILDGDHYMSPSPQTAHQRVLADFYYILRQEVEERRIGEVFLSPYDVVLSDTSIVVPDLVYVSNARSDIIKKENIRGVPDLLIEIVSPSNPTRDTQRKRSIYEKQGVPYYWVIDPVNRTVTELVLTGPAYKLRSDLAGEAVFKPEIFPGLVIDLSAVWPQDRT